LLTGGKSTAAGSLTLMANLPQVFGVAAIHVNLFDNDSKFVAGVKDASNQSENAVTDIGGSPALHLEIKISP
jgi:hypothetical protein